MLVTTKLAKGITRSERLHRDVDQWKKKRVMVSVSTAHAGKT